MSGAPRLRAGAVTVRPPATSANLGPGFDSFGLALDLRDEVVVEVIDAPGLAVTVEGEGAGQVPRDENHLLVRSLRQGFDALGGRPRGLRVHCRNVIPHGRGLGSSSAAICAGLYAARALVENGEQLLDDNALLRIASAIEGHPDNVAPALLGGLTIAWMQSPAENGGDGLEQDGNDLGQPGRELAGALRLTPVDAVAATVFIPPEPLATAVARGLLPKAVPHRDAAFNAGRAGLLIAALTSGELSRHHRSALLGDAVLDRLHQDYRAPAMPRSAELVRRLRADGFAAAVSGAGPTVVVLTCETSEADRVAAHAPGGWRTLRLPIAARGVYADAEARPAARNP